MTELAASVGRQRSERARTDPFAAGLDPTDDAALASSVVERSEFAVALIDLATLRVVAISDPAAALLDLTPPEMLGRLAQDFLADEPTGGLPLLATGRLEGFEAVRRLRRRDGGVLEAYVWVHALGSRRPARFGGVFLSRSAQPSPPHLAPGDDRKVIGTVDDEWRIDRISMEVESVLGYRVDKVAGAPLLSAVNPHDLPELLTGLAHVHATSRDAVIRVRARTSAQGWLWCRAHLASIGEPPRFAFTLRPLVEGRRISSAERARDLELRLARIANEIRTAGLTVPSTDVPNLAEVSELSSLTSREWEVLSRLAEGDRVLAIAKELGLSPSTVRNHLSAIYRKLGVGSQAELLDRLRARPGPPPADGG